MLAPLVLMCQTRGGCFLQVTHLKVTVILLSNEAPSQEIQPENEPIKTQPQGVQPGEILVWDVTQQGGIERKERETINGKCVI